MRTTYKAIAAAAAATMLLASCGGGSENPSGDGDKITIGIKFDQPGLGFKEGDSYTGFDVEVARYVADKLGYAEDQIEWVEAISANREEMLKNGQVDMIFATYSITESRDEVVDFAGPYFVAGQDLLVRTDDTSITGPESLAGKNLCSVSGSTSAQRVKDDFDSGDGINLVEQPGYSECLSLLQGGQVDAATTDDIILAGLAAEEGSGAFRVVGNPFSEERYGIGIPEGSDQCNAINEAVQAMIDDGSWETAIAEATDGTGYTPNASLNPPTLVECK
ncbi:glutamate ABC transporter substrate-binding protein [Populibacterium corticicola]|jgi:glutamate transport system substrate-binding protein|uniref:Glutamate ABC transporter substrate-binding protein n=1 Tax=Populibacterium corticicola TaxID=1812826 RepID=A0ABW5XB95_9MICO